MFEGRRLHPEARASSPWRVGTCFSAKRTRRPGRFSPGNTVIGTFIGYLACARLLPPPSPSFLGRLCCVLGELWQRHTSRDEIPVTVSVKNGRWRVGRGAMCTLGRSPAPKGSLRRFLPWDEKTPGKSAGGSFPFGRRLGGDRLRTERVVGFFDRLSRGSAWVHMGAHLVALFFFGVEGRVGKVEPRRGGTSAGIMLEGSQKPTVEREEERRPWLFLHHLHFAVCKSHERRSDPAITTCSLDGVDWACRKRVTLR